MSEKTLTVTIEGVRPLLMSNPQTVDIENAYAVESRRLNKEFKQARRKNEETKLLRLCQEQKLNDFQSSAYFDAEAKHFFLPDTVILACIKESAKSLKKGKDIDRAVILEEWRVPIQNVPSVKSLASANENEAFRFQSPCRIPPKTGALVWKLRCMMPTGWRMTFTLKYDNDFIEDGDLKDVVENAGIMVGLGGWRPKFGRFKTSFN